MIILSIYKYHFSDWDDNVFVGLGYLPVGLILMSFVVGICVLLYKTTTAVKKRCKRRRKAVMPQFVVKRKGSDEEKNKPTTTACLTSERDEQGDRMTTG